MTQAAPTPPRPDRRSEDPEAPPRPPYRIAGPDTWALVREAYLGGLSARRCAERYGVGVSNLKRRAHTEGWTRRDHALRLEVQWRDTPASAPVAWPGRPPAPDLYPPAPEDALVQALEHVDRQLASGDGRSALQTLKAIDVYADSLIKAKAALPPTPEEERAARASAEAERIAEREHWEQSVWDRAHKVAEELLTEQGVSGACWSLAAFHWRARVLGPEVARQDFGRAINGNWANRYYEVDGRLKPMAGSEHFDDFALRALRNLTGSETMPDRAGQVGDEARHEAQNEWGAVDPPEPSALEEPPAPSPTPEAAQDAIGTRPKKSFQERVREASGKSGPVTRW